MVERRDYVRSFRAYDGQGGEYHLFLFATAVDAAAPEVPGRDPFASRGPVDSTPGASRT